MQSVKPPQKKASYDFYSNMADSYIQKQQQHQTDFNWNEKYASGYTSN